MAVPVWKRDTARSSISREASSIQCRFLDDHQHRPLEAGSRHHPVDGVEGPALEVSSGDLVDSRSR
jgi:hypothetical protein